MQLKDIFKNTNYNNTQFTDTEIEGMRKILCVSFQHNSTEQPTVPVISGIFEQSRLASPFILVLIAIKSLIK